jgi:hypothetical protein
MADGRRAPTIKNRNASRGDVLCCADTHVNRSIAAMTDITNEPASWRPYAWLEAAGHPFSLPILYREIRRGAIDARKRGRSTIILTPPATYLASLPRGIGPAIKRRAIAANTSGE